jgi:hypothetical protein
MRHSVDPTRFEVVAGSELSRPWLPRLHWRSCHWNGPWLLDDASALVGSSSGASGL